MQTIEQKISSDNSTTNFGEKKLEGKKVFLAGLSVFLFALIVTLSFHFLSGGPKRTLCFDARQYIFDTSRITEFLLALVHGQWKPQLVTEATFLTSILADGPAFPSFFGSIFALMGHAPGIQDCRAIEIIQSILHACSASMIFGLSFVFCKRIVPSFCSGLIWAAYPAAIFWSGIFYTETTVIFSTLLFVSLLASSQRLVKAVLAGVMAGVVALLKPALLPAAAVASLFSLRFSRKSLFALAVGAVLALSPWLLYTKTMTGQARITAQRFPAFNFAMGSDTEVDACLVSPAPPLTTMFSKDDEKPYAFPLAQWQFHTLDCLRLSAVKLSSLWSRQANDFRQSFFGVSPAQQNVWHLFLLFSGITGLLLFLTSIRSVLDLRICSYGRSAGGSPASMELTRRQQTIAFASIIFIGTHLCYVLFTPAARYGLTAMPFYLIFASLAFSGGWHGHSRPFNRKQALALAACASIASLIVLALAKGTLLSPVFQQKEIAYKLNDNTSAMRVIDLSNSKAPDPKQVFSVLLLVDGDNGLENADIEVNTHKLDSKLQHIRSFESELYQQSFELRSLGYPAGLSADDFRHWRAVRVPAALINWNGQNKFRITQHGTGTIYADPTNDRRMLATNYFSVNSLCNSDTSLDLRIASPIKTSAAPTQSYVNSEEPLNSSLRIKLAVALGEPWQNQQQTSSELIAQKKLSSKSFDLYVQDPTVDGVRINRINMKAARSTGCVTELQDLSKSGWLRVRVEGDLRGKSEGKAEVVVALQPAKQNPALVLNMAPQQIAYNGGWKHFVIEDLVPAKLLAENQKHSLYLAAYPGPWLDFCGYTADKRCGDAQFRNLSFQIRAEERPDFAFKRMLYY